MRLRDGRHDGRKIQEGNPVAIQRYCKPLPLLGVPVSRPAEKFGIVDSVAHLSISLVERRAMRELSDAELQRVNKHIASCSECEEWVQAEIAQTAAIRSWPTKIRKIEKAACKAK